MNQFKYFPQTLVVARACLLISFLSSCVSTQEVQSESQSAYMHYIESEKIENIDKITSFRYQGWRKLDGVHLMIRSAYNKHFFIRLKSTCPHLKTSKSIIVRNSTSNTFIARFDSISPGKFPGLKCFVKDIYPITQGQADEINALDKKAQAVKGELTS